MKIVTVFDGYKYVGTMQICVARMLQESGIFFAVCAVAGLASILKLLTVIQLLSVLTLGFGQGLYALDASDGKTESTGAVRVGFLPLRKILTTLPQIVDVLIQALLQSPDYGKFKESTMGLTLYYLCVHPLQGPPFLNLQLTHI
jgi:hypothetical protein